MYRVNNTYVPLSGAVGNQRSNQEECRKSSGNGCESRRTVTSDSRKGFTALYMRTVKSLAVIHITTAGVGNCAKLPLLSLAVSRIRLSPHRFVMRITELGLVSRLL